MSLRWRLAAVLSVTVAVTALVIGVIAYAAMARELRARTDDALVNQAFRVAEDFGRSGGQPPRTSAPPVTGSAQLTQIIDPQAAALPNQGSGAIPITDAARAIATSNGTATASFTDVPISGVTYRVYTMPLPRGGAVQTAVDVSGLDAVLANLRQILLGLAAVSALAAGAVGLVVARRTVRPIEQLTAAAEHIAETKELDAAIPTTKVGDAGDRDEVERLARAFNEMLEALAQSRAQQQRLVQDAGHELRTPLTSLRTNLEVLGQPGAIERLDPAERQQLIGDLVNEVGELNELVTELVEAARSTGREDEPVVSLGLDELVRSVARRAASRTGREVDLSAVEPCTVDARPAAIERAVTNLLTNAAKFSPPNTKIEISLTRDARLAVRDHGDGIPERDLPHVFERFYRADAARSVTGSGLGLAIVDQIVRAHGGTTFATNAPADGDGDGGAIVGFTLPTPT